MKLIDGRMVRKEKLEELKEKLTKLQNKPNLVVIEVGNDEASKVYIKQKEKLAQELEYNFIYKHFREDITEEELLKEISIWNNDPLINGIMIQLPIPKHLNSTKVINAINPLKDVDGLTSINAGRLIQNMPGLIPCTAKGIIDLLDYYHIPIEGADAVVIGRSLLVGKPVANLLTNRNASVTLLHSKSQNISYYTKNADIVIVAVGIPYFLTKEMIKENAVIIDVGINRVKDKLVGDTDFENLKDSCSYITPVPGGVGPMTVYELMNNVYLARKLQKNRN